MLAERTTVIMRREHERYHQPLVRTPLHPAAVLALVGAARVGRLALLVCACMLISLGALGQLIVRELEGGHGLEG